MNPMQEIHYNIHFVFISWFVRSVIQLHCYDPQLHSDSELLYNTRPSDTDAFERLTHTPRHLTSRTAAAHPRFLLSGDHKDSLSPTPPPQTGSSQCPRTASWECGDPGLKSKDIRKHRCTKQPPRPPSPPPLLISQLSTQSCPNLDLWVELVFKFS